MCATNPAAGATLAFEKFFAGALDTPSPSDGLLGVENPADKFVASKWCDVVPERRDSLVGERCSQIRRKFVRAGSAENLCHEYSILEV